jgi:hypothetical protein
VGVDTGAARSSASSLLLWPTSRATPMIILRG